MATAAQKHRKARLRRAHQRQSLERNAAQGHTGGPDTAKRSIHENLPAQPSHHKKDLPKHGAELKTKERLISDIAAGRKVIEMVGVCPSQKEFDDMVARGKKRKQSLTKFATAKGWVLVGEDPKVKDHWEISDEAKAA